MWPPPPPIGCLSCRWVCDLTAWRLFNDSAARRSRPRHVSFLAAVFLSFFFIWSAMPSVSTFAERLRVWTPLIPRVHERPATFWAAFWSQRAAGRLFSPRLSTRSRGEAEDQQLRPKLTQPKYKPTAAAERTHPIGQTCLNTPTPSERACARYRLPCRRRWVTVAVISGCGAECFQVRLNPYSSC